MTNKIGNLTCHITRVIPVYTKHIAQHPLAGGAVIHRDMENPTRSWQVDVMLTAGARGKAGTLENLESASYPCVLQYDAESVTGGTQDYIFGYIRSLEKVPEPNGKIDAYSASLKFDEITWWGRTYVNSGTALLHDLDYQGPGKQEIFDPKWGKHNFTLDRDSAKKFTYECILTGNLEEINAIEIYDDEETFWTLIEYGTGDYHWIISEDTAYKIKGTSCLKLVCEAGTKAYYDIAHDYGSNQDWSGKDFFCMWIYGNNTNVNRIIYLKCPDNSNRMGWYFSDNYVGWKRFVFPLLGDYDLLTGSPNLAQVRTVIFYDYPSYALGTWYFDRMVVDTGQWVKIEHQIPDEMKKGTAYHTNYYSWNVGSGAYAAAFAAVSIASGDINTGYLYLLNGSTVSTVKGAVTLGARPYLVGAKGETKTDGPGNGDNNAGDITYSQLKGLKYKGGVAVFMPPSTMCRDTTGIGAINKAKLKIEVYFNDEYSSLVN